MNLLNVIDAALAGRTTSDPAAPWLGWLTVALLRQRARQVWHREIVNTRLEAEEGEHDRGDVPGLDGWTYDFHGIGCCLRGPDGEEVDVDRNDDDAAIIDPWFFARRIETIRARSLPEARLWRWLPSTGVLIAALTELREAGLIVYPGERHLFRLATPLEERVKGVSECDFGNPDIMDRWAKALGDSEEEAMLAAHRHAIRRYAMDRDHGPHALEAASRILPQEELVALCLDLMAGPIGAITGAAIVALPEGRRDNVTGAALAVLDRLSPTDDPPYPAYVALAYLLERKLGTDRVVAHFRQFAGVEVAHGFRGNPFLGRYAVLALRYVPEMAMSLVRRALRSTTPVAVSDIASVLCAVGQPWCIRELTSALSDARTNSTIAEALRRSTSELAKRQAAMLYVPPSHDAKRIGYSYEEVAHSMATESFDASLKDIAPLAEVIRSRYPATWGG